MKLFKTMVQFLCGFVVLNVFAGVCYGKTGITVPNVALDGYVQDTPPENRFRLAADLNTEYVLLGAVDDGFLITTERVYDAVAFDEDGTQRFDIADENNIGYYLNHTFYNDYVSSALKEGLNSSHVWKTEGGSPDGNCDEEYTFTAPVALPSYTEFMEYYKNIGFWDTDNRINWWLRSAPGDSGTKNIAVGGTYANRGKLVTESAALKSGIRPIFCLKKDFFKIVKADPIHMGAWVKENILSAYSELELQECGLYTDQELIKIGCRTVEAPQEGVEISIPSVSSAPTGDFYLYEQKDAYFRVVLHSSYPQKRDYTIEYVVDQGEPVSQTIPLEQYERKDIRISLDHLKKGIRSVDVKVYSPESLVAYESYEMPIMSFYEAQPLDEMSRVGICTHLTNRPYEENYFYGLQKIGINKIRDTFEWGSLEKTKDVYKPADILESYAKAIFKKNISYSPIVAAYGNVVHTGFSDKMRPPITKAAADAYLRYARQMENVSSKIEAYEIWNEPNVTTFWKPKPNFLDYVSLMNPTAYGLKQTYPDKKIIGISAASQEAQKLFDICLRNGMLMYVDEFSFHPYTYPNDPDVRYESRVDEYMEAFKKHGGWIEASVTEVGWPTHHAFNGTSYEDQAIYLVKALIYGDNMDFSQTVLYDIRNDGIDDTYVEHEFGIFEYDNKAKPSVISLAQYNIVNANAQYIGRMSLGEGIIGYVYQKLGKPHVIAWAPDGNTYLYQRKEGEVIQDMWGNPLSEQVIQVGKEPIYIFNVEQNYVSRALLYDTEALLEELKTNYGDKINFCDMEEWLQGYQENPPKGIAEVKNYLDGFYDHAMSVYDCAMTQGLMSGEECHWMLFRMHQTGEDMAQALAQFDMDYSLKNGYLQEVQAQIAARKGEYPESGLYFTDAAMKYVERYQRAYDTISAADFDGKYGCRAVYNYRIHKTCQLALCMMKYEAPDISRGMFTWCSETQSDIYSGQSKEYTVTLDNKRGVDYTGQVVLRDQNGKDLGYRVDLAVRNGECGEATVQGSVAPGVEEGEYIYYIAFLQDGQEIKRQEIEVTLKDIAKMRFLDIMTPLEELQTIDVEVTTMSREEVKGSLTVEAPEGWKLKTKTKDYIVSADAPQILSFEVEAYSRKPFNEYNFVLELKDEQDNRIAVQKRTLQVLVTVHAKEEIMLENFDGSIEGWEDAYPIYANAPEDIGNIEEWKESDIAIKALTKWDENYFYVLADVYDDLFLNTFSGFEIWQGDSVQLSFDSLNDKVPQGGKGYQSDDYEFGFARAPGGNESYVYEGTDVEIGSAPPEWVRIVRDDDRKITRYLIKIPAGYMNQMKLQEGHEFGFNIAANDADILNRDSWAEMTPGTVAAKDPSVYATFVLRRSAAEYSAENDGTSFPAKVLEISHGG